MITSGLLDSQLHYYGLVITFGFRYEHSLHWMKTLVLLADWVKDDLVGAP